MKVIFLDIDGVLINRASLVKASSWHAEGAPECVAALNRLIQATDAYIVVSSTWRKLGLIKMKDHLLAWGVKSNVLGLTPDLTGNHGTLYTGATRGTEIQAWLDSYDRYPVESFVILDDDSDMGGLLPFLVKTNTEAGLTEADVDRAIVILNEPAKVAA